MFEIHITVDTDNVEQFVKDCKELGVKSVIVQMPTKDGKLKTDIMTSSVVHSDITTIQKYAFNEAKKLKDKGYNVLRVKAEVNANSPLVKTPGLNPDAVYYETHFEFETKNPIQEYIVKNFCQYSNTYFSYNVNKCEGDNKVIMLTIRDKKISQEDYFKKVESITSDMKKALLPLIKVQSEFAVFDSNPEHDNPWLN